MPRYVTPFIIFAQIATAARHALDAPELVQNAPSNNLESVSAQKLNQSNRFLFTMMFVLGVSAGSQGKAQIFYPETDATRRTYDDVELLLQNLATTHAENVSLINIGNSDSKKMIKGLKIGHGNVETLVVGTHHGNEYGSTEVALAFAKDMAEKPIENRTVYVIPVLNIGGYNRKSRYEEGSKGSFDPNRNYPGPCGTEGPFTLQSIKSMDTFLANTNIVASATLHTYWPVVAYPWGNSTSNYSTPYDDIFKKLASSATFLSHYETGFSGAAIYPADGTFEDYAFWKYGMWSLLFELGNSHYPNANDIDTLVRVNVPGLRKMMEDAPVTRAADHAFHSSCNLELKAYDLHIE